MQQTPIFSLGFGLRLTLLILLALAVMSSPRASSHAHPAGEDAVWKDLDGGGQGRVHLYFFWSNGCPHCKQAIPFVNELDQRLKWLHVESLPLSDHPEHQRRYIEMAEAIGEQARSVPAFLFCGRMVTGFDHADGVGAYLERALRECREDAADPQAITATPIPESLAGIDLQTLSLPLMTLVIAGLDAFNPCAFFVLLSLLSLLVHARSRRRIALIGGIFVLFSGLIYFVFMAAWLNLFLLFGAVRWITLAAGLVALTIALLNIKDFFLFGVGPSVSIPESAKPGIFQRMRGLLQSDNRWGLLVGTVVLAIAVNSYELLCTSGLPMIYTRLLTLEELPTGVYYLYLAAYNLVYVIPLAIIVTLFTLTLGSRKLQAREGRLLKLMSGSMMLGLGALLIFYPDGLSNLWIALAILAGAVAVTAVAALATRKGSR